MAPKSSSKTSMTGESASSSMGARSDSRYKSAVYEQPAARVGPSEAWVTVPVPDASGGLQFRPRGFSVDETEGTGSTAWSIKSRYMMATRSGPTEVPDHIQARHQHFGKDGESFASPYTLYYFDETAPNNIMLANDLRKECKGLDGDSRVPTNTGGRKSKVSGKEAMSYNVRKMFFDVDDLRVPENGTGLKMLPSYTVSYKNYPAVAYDVIAPKNYLDFFRNRTVPGLFA